MHAAQGFAVLRPARRRTSGHDHARVPRSRFTILAVPVAVLAEASAWRDLEPDGFAAFVYVAVVVGLLAVGALAGWRGVVVFIPVFVVAAIIETALIYEAPPAAGCDPFCSSPESGVAFGLPFELIVVGIGMAGRGLAKAVLARRASAS